MKVPLHIYLTPELVAALKQQAKENDRSISGEIENLLRKPMQARVNRMVTEGVAPEPRRS